MSDLARRVAATCLAVAFGLAAAPALADTPNVIWAKVGTPSPVMETDYNACVRESDTVGVAVSAEFERQLGGDGYGPVGIAIGTGVVGGFFSSALTPGARSSYLRTCMLGRGYHAIGLSPEEVSAFDSVKTPEARTVWLAQFYNRSDFAQRLAASSPASLRESNDESLTYGAVRFNPAALTPATGIVRVGGVVLSGSIGHRRTAQVQKDIRARFGSGAAQISAGSVLQQVVFPDEDGTDRTYWCGPFTRAMFTEVVCARKDADHYFLVHARGARWITTGLDPNDGTGEADSDAYITKESADDLVGSIGFALAVRKLSKTSITLEAVVNQGSDYETLWEKELPLDVNGAAILAFWTHRLVLTRSGDGVSVTFQADGDGSGWPFQPVSN